MIRWTCLGLLAVATGLDVTTPPTADPVAEERARNHAAYEASYLSRKELLVADHPGAWLVIAGGEVLPRDRRGHPDPASTMEGALAAAESRHPQARHRYVFRIGEEGEVRYAPTLSAERAYVGSMFLERSGVDWMVAAGGTWFRRPGAEVPEDARAPVPGYVRVGDGPNLAATLAFPGGPPSPPLRLRIATGYGGPLVIGSEHAAALGLARFEIPGRIRLADGLHLRRARVRIEVPPAALSLTLPAGILP